MRKRINIRLVLLFSLLLGLGALQIAGEHRPSLLRSDLRLFAYVTNTAEGTLTAIDLAQLSAVATIAVGPEPSGLRAHPRRGEIWGVSTGAGEVWVLDARAGAIAARLAVGAGPFAVDFSPEGTHAYIAASGADTLVAVNCAERRIVGRARTGRRPWIARVTPDGKRVLVANREESTVSVLDAETLQEKARIPVAANPEHVVVLPDSSKAFVAAGGARVVTVLDLKRNVVLANLPLYGRAADLILKPDGGEIFAPSPETHGLAILNTWQNEYAEHVLLGNTPTRGTVTADGQTLYVSDAANARILPVQVQFRQLDKGVSVGQRPGVSRLTPAQDLLVVVNEESNDVAVLRTRDNALLTLIPTGRAPRDLAILLF